MKPFDFPGSDPTTIIDESLKILFKLLFLTRALGKDNKRQKYLNLMTQYYIQAIDEASDIFRRLFVRLRTTQASGFNKARFLSVLSNVAMEVPIAKDAYIAAGIIPLLKELIHDETSLNGKHLLWQTLWPDIYLDRNESTSETLNNILAQFSDNSYVFMVL